MTFAELNKATDNFNSDNIIGLGKMGTVYKATLPNGLFLAVKRLYDSQQLEKQFMCELTILGRLRHYHLLPPLGILRRKEREDFGVQIYVQRKSL